MGDCFTPDRTLALATLLRSFLVKSAGVALGMDDSAAGPRSISTGDDELVGPRKGSNMERESFWECRAGEVSGLKYAAEAANADSVENCVSSGVTAGDTSGVNDICAKVSNQPPQRWITSKPSYV